MEYLDFFSVDVWTIIFTWVNMFILFLIVKKLLFKPVNNMLQQREDEIKKIYDDANTANEKAENLEKEYSEKMAQARDEAGGIIKQATETAQKREEEIVADAQDKADSIMKKAEEEIELERKKAYREIKGEISDISVAIAGQLVKRELTVRDHDSLIQDFIESVGGDNE